MKKRNTLLFFLLIISGAYCQEQIEQKSKMLDFISKTGVIIKYENYNLPNVKLNYGIAESKIRKIISGNEERFFLQISKAGKYDTKTASIAYEDLLEIQKALEILKSKSELDLSSTADYLENKFITEDGFQVGYYVSKGKVSWYIQLESYGSGNTAFLKNYDTLLNTFQLGKEKIENLK